MVSSDLYVVCDASYLPAVINNEHVLILFRSLHIAHYSQQKLHVPTCAWRPQNGDGNKIFNIKKLIKYNSKCHPDMTLYIQNNIILQNLSKKQKSGTNALMRMRKHNLTLNLKKCIFAKPKVK